MEVHASSGERRRRIDDARCVRDVLRFELLSGRTRPERLTDEHRLLTRLGCSRNTLREALELLRAERLIERKQGVGTLVRPSRVPISASEADGLSTTLGDARVEYSAYAPRHVRNAAVAADVLGMPEDAPLVVLTRVTKVDGEPTCIWDNYVAARVASDLATWRSDEDFFVSFERCVGIRITEVSLRVEAVLADVSVSHVLGTRVGDPLLQFERQSRSDDGAVVALSFGRARADQLALSIVHDRRDHDRGSGPYLELRP